jgi:hypothetical protein
MFSKRSYCFCMNAILSIIMLTSNWIYWKGMHNTPLSKVRLPSNIISCPSRVYVSLCVWTISYNMCEPVFMNAWDFQGGGGVSYVTSQL